MATAKAVPDKEKKDEGDAGGTAFFPSATPPVNPETGEDVDVHGNDALEHQRAAFEEAAKQEEENEGGPLEREGEEADFQAAKMNPESSGHADVTEVKKQETKTKAENKKTDAKVQAQLDKKEDKK
jgi:hypothetical protein